MEPPPWELSVGYFVLYNERLPLAAYLAAYLAAAFAAISYGGDNT
jgi:hypothetical protein